MAYGNVTPSTLPTYDAETNGFYLLVFNYELGAENWYMVHLIYGAWRFQYEEGVGITNTGNTFTRTYSDGVWSEESQNTVALALNPGVNGQVYQRIYTNANIFNGDELWLAENSVTPLDEEQRQINMKSQLAGFLGSWVSRVRQFPQREPVAFLYNGVRLPALPDWDKEKYPYALIYNILSSTYFVAMDGAYYWNGYGLFIDQSGIMTRANLANGAWAEWGESTYAPHNPGVPVPIWANYDILNEEGTVYLAASEPVPIYE